MEIYNIVPGEVFLYLIPDIPKTDDNLNWFRNEILRDIIQKFPARSSNLFFESEGLSAIVVLGLDNYIK